MSSPPGKFKPGEGDWICTASKCGNVNFSRRTQCNRCGVEKNDGQDCKKGGTEIGKTLAEKSKGLFSADDWQCKTCGNVNWARRMTCNMCNTPKYGKLEQRTGYGGGYMERDEVVEYKERVVESEDEYDEFGRKKKKFRGQSTEGPSGTTASPSKPKTSEEEEEDELDSDEEDEEGEDLSQYDLVDDDDDDDVGDDKKNPVKDDQNTDNGRKNRSRSRSESGSSSSSSSSSRSRSRDRSRQRSYSRSRSRSTSRHRHGRSSSCSRSSESKSRSRSRSHERRRDQHKRRRSRFDNKTTAALLNDTV